MFISIVEGVGSVRGGGLFFLKLIILVLYYFLQETLTKLGMKKAISNFFI